MDGWFLSFCSAREALVRLQDSGGALVTCGLEVVGKALVAHSHDLDGKDGGVFRPVDSDGGNGDPLGIWTVESSASMPSSFAPLAGHADDGKRRIRRHARRPSARPYPRRDDYKKIRSPVPPLKFLPRSGTGGG